jgi:hypothetical protein
MKRIVCVLGALAAFGVTGTMSTSESVAVAGEHEVMIDRCSGEVAFTPTYDANPTTHGTVVLKRGANGYSPWTTFTRQTGDDGHVRWWCHSTTGNVFDPGTWRVSVDASGVAACLVSVGAAVASDGAASPAVTSCLKTIKLGSSAFHGWTPERSRCGDHSTKFRARLGPDRLLETECLGH